MVTVAVLYLVGFATWIYILDGGHIPFGLHDWAEGTGHRLAFLQNAVRQGLLPLHMPDGSALRNITDRFMSIPDTILSPQVLLLGILDLGQFVLANTLLLYTVGMAGLLVLARRLQLSPFSFAIVFLLFSFNGHITDHIVVGNMHWVGYFLLPFFILLVLQSLEQVPGWSWVTEIGLLLTLMFLQGAFHLFVICLIFLLLLALGQPRLGGPALKASAAAVLLSMGRILPAALEVGRFDSAFLSGFASVQQLLASLVEIRVPIQAQVFDVSPLNPLGWWEIDHYVGLVGLAFLLLCGIGLGLRENSRLRQLSVPVFGMLFLSIGRIYRPVNLLGIPLISSQRVSSRFAILTLLFLVVLGARSAQQWIRDSSLSSGKRAGLTALLLLLGHDLWQHLKLWRIRGMYELFPLREVDLTGEYIANHADLPYSIALASGWGVALAALIALVVLARRERKQVAQGRSAGLT